MTAQLCATRPAEWWDSTGDGARLGIAICRHCPGRVTCLGDDKPAGVIRAGVAFSDAGKPLALCPTCGYPQTGRLRDTCRRCEVPTLGRWLPDLKRWRSAGVPDEVAGRRLGATAKQVQGALQDRPAAKAVA